MHDPKTLLHDPSIYRLGKKAVRHDARTLQLVKYLGAALPPPPATCIWSTKTDRKWPMFMNDSIGDCTCATAAHMEQVWSAAGIKKEITVADADVLAMYEGAAGYNPKDPSTDQGAVELDVLKFWQKTGLAGNKIGPYAAISVQSKTITKDGIYLFGGIYTGFALPVSAQSQAVWDVPASGARGRGAPGSWGGHAVPVVDYDARGLTCVTWGALKRMTWAFYRAYCVAPETRVLTDDLQWLPIGDLEEGQGLLGFDEHVPAAGFHRQWRKTSIESKRLIERPCYDLTFDDGTTIRCSEEHQWLVCRGNNLAWVKTENLRCEGKVHSKVVKPLDVWRTADDWRGGYLAAAFDGEGCLTQRDLSADKDRCQGLVGTSIGFSQKDNAMLAEVKNCLQEEGFHYNQHDRVDNGVVHLSISRRPDVIRFMGSIRPRRLLAKFDPSRLGAVTNNQSSAVMLVEKKFVGMQTVVAVKTGTGTFLAEGLASHNCDEAYAIIDEHFLSGGKSPAGFDVATLTADLAKLR